MLKSLELRVRRTIQTFGMLAGGEHVLVAVSGGPDSVALLLCLHALTPDLHLNLTVAHLNHGIRGTDANADEQFVHQLSAGLSLPCISEFIRIQDLAKSVRGNLEELAREKRYEFLRRTAQRAGATKIAVGHTMNDQAETALFRFIRGSGIEGLAAIYPVKDGTVIRPLLECPRDSVIEYLKQREAVFCEDSTNRDSRFSRNRLRNEVIPLLVRDFNPQLIATLAREASMARETWDFIESHAREIFEKVHSRDGSSISLWSAEIRKLHPALQKEVLRQGIRECIGSLRGISSVHIQGIVGLLGMEQSGAQIQLPHGLLAIRQFDRILLMNDPPRPHEAFEYELCVPGRCSVPEAQMEFTATICPPPDLQKIKGTCSTQAFLHPPSLDSKLAIRSRQPGDRYGGPGHRKLKKMLINTRIPASRRSALPIVVCGSDVIWVPGFRPARGYEVRADSPNCIRIELTRTD